MDAVTFKRMNKNSKLAWRWAGFFEIDDFENEQTQVLQVVFVPQHDGNGGFFMVEYISRLEEEMTSPVGTTTTDIDFENYLETTINKDPFGGKYSGKQIKDVFLAGDKAWLDNALSNMKNDFIRDRLEYIVARGGYGKINNK